MNKLDIVSKCIQLLYRESFVQNNDNNSNDIIKDVLKNISSENKFTLKGGDQSIVDDLKMLVMQYLNDTDDEPINRNLLVSSLRSIIVDRPELDSLLTTPILNDMDEKESLSTVRSIRTSLGTFLLNIKVTNALKIALYKATNDTESKSNIKEFIANTINDLDTISDSGAIIDPAIGAEVDFDNMNQISEQIDAAKADLTSDGKLKLGWKAMNRMTDNGIRPGEFVVVNALAHKYKSGMVASMFCQLAQNNKPKLIDPNKKPLLLLISLEDDLPIVFKFIYKYLYYNEYKLLPDMKYTTTEEMTKYIKDKLTANGWFVKMIRVNPTDWTYKHMFDKTNSYEAEGYEIKGIICDYLSLIPTIGCRNDGPAGTDLRYLFRKVRNHYAAKKTSFITPHQLSTEAKQLLRNGTPDSLFVKDIANKSYFSGSKQLDQEMDLELYIHICKIKGVPYLAVGRGKHRGAPIIDEKHLFFLLPFPKGAPIPSDMEGKEITYNEDDENLTGNLDLDLAMPIAV